MGQDTLNKVIWQSNRFFKEKFVVIGSWNFSSCENFPRTDFLSADTETKIYLNDKVMTEDECYNLFKSKKEKWCRENLEVKAYAFMLSDGINFALFQNAEDFLTCCAMMHVKIVFWYNARFDFSIFDNFFGRNEWVDSDSRIKNKTGFGKLPDKTYQSLNGEFGQRYELRIWKSYKDRKRNIKVHNFKMIDICNIFGGGLRKNLEDWNIVDKENKEVRKLHMDYVNATVESDIDYMVNDTKGLHLLAEKINETVYKLSGFSLFDGDYITAGGLAKKSLLKFMFGKDKPKDNIYYFKNYFPMTIEEDKYARDNKLYQGGKCLVNKKYIAKPIGPIYKYDVNSMYPDKMRNMLYPVGKYKKVDKISNDKNKIYILKISNIFGVLNKNMIPVWYDTILKEYTEQIFEQEERLIWLEELRELENYYSLIYNIDEIWEFEGKKCKGAIEYVDNYYEVKKNGVGTIRTGAKLFLNSAYGKIAQKIERANVKYELTEEGYVHLVNYGTEIDEKAMLSIYVGSRITALGRVSLMKYIRIICRNNPKKYFIYCDTDSVHALLPFEDTDSKALGKMKSEGVYEKGIYLAPKTYLDYNNLEHKYKDNESKYEVHCKGVNTEVVQKEIDKCKSFEEVKNIFKAGVKFKCLTSLNVKGGKALIYVDKLLLNPEKLEGIEEDELED